MRDLGHKSTRILIVLSACVLLVVVLSFYAVSIAYAEDPTQTPTPTRTPYRTTIWDPNAPTATQVPIGDCPPLEEMHDKDLYDWQYQYYCDHCFSPTATPWVYATDTPAWVETTPTVTGTITATVTTTPTGPVEGYYLNPYVNSASWTRPQGTAMKGMGWVYYVETPGRAYGVIFTAGYQFNGKLVRANHSDYPDTNGVPDFWNLTTGDNFTQGVQYCITNNPLEPYTRQTMCQELSGNPDIVVLSLTGGWLQGFYSVTFGCYAGSSTPSGICYIEDVYTIEYGVPPSPTPTPTAPPPTPEIGLCYNHEDHLRPEGDDGVSFGIGEVYIEEGPCMTIVPGLEIDISGLKAVLSAIIDVDSWPDLLGWPAVGFCVDWINVEALKLFGLTIPVQMALYVIASAWALDKILDSM